MTKARDELIKSIAAELSVLVCEPVEKTPMLERLAGKLDRILSQVDTYVKGIINTEIPQETHKYREYHWSSYFAGQSALRAEQRNRAGLEEEKDNA